MQHALGLHAVHAQINARSVAHAVSRVRTEGEGEAQVGGDRALTKICAVPRGTATGVGSHEVYRKSLGSGMNSG